MARAKIKSLGVIKNRLNLSQTKVLYIFLFYQNELLLSDLDIFKVKHSKTKLTKLKKNA